MPKTIIITGASGIIGAATAHTLSQQGYHLLLIDKNEQALHKLSATILNSSWIVADVTDADAITAAFDTVAKDLEGVVLAAAIEGPIGLLEDCSNDAFLKVMTTNVTSVWLGIKESLRILKPKGHGSVVVISSISGVQAAPLLSPYCASKHAILGLMKTAAREAAPHGVRLNAVCPGPVTSPMMARIESATNKDNRHSIPLQRYADPQEIANVIAFLCAESSQYCTGTTMMVDGGLTCR